MDDELHEVKKFRSDLAVQDEAKADYYRRRFETEREQGARAGRSARWSLPLRGRRVWVPLTAAVLTLGVIVGVVALQDGWKTGPVGSDGSILKQAAADLAASDASVTVPNATQWYYYNEVSERETGFGTETTESANWRRADFKAVASRNDAGNVSTSAIEGGIPKLGGVFPDLAETYQFYAQLSDDPKAVLEAIYAKVDENDLTSVPRVSCYPSCRRMVDKPPWYRDASAFELIRALLWNSAPPDAVQAKLFRAMAEIPGVEDVGTVTDTTGKDVLAVQWHAPSDAQQEDITVRGQTQILIDPETNRFRGYKLVDTESGEPSHSKALLDAGVVNQPGQTP